MLKLSVLALGLVLLAAAAPRPSSAAGGSPAAQFAPPAYAVRDTLKGLSLFH